MRSTRPSRPGAPFVRALAALLAAFALVTAPATALAETENIWSIWADEIFERHPAEVPLAVLISLPCMVFVTPFWLGQLAIGAASGDE